MPLVNRYRKVNLYMEAQFDAPDTPDSVTFETDFGVTFGTFTCFDILFPVPGLTLTREQAISNIIFTTAWFSEVPFLTGKRARAYIHTIRYIAPRIATNH